jgi:hypothetical protein
LIKIDESKSLKTDFLKITAIKTLDVKFQDFNTDLIEANKKIEEEIKFEEYL